MITNKEGTFYIKPLFVYSHYEKQSHSKILSMAIIGTGIWLLIDMGVINADSTSAITWLLLIALAILLAAGLSWAHLKRRITGQVEVDDVEG